MEDYKNSKIGQETARKYADILAESRPDGEESCRKHPRMTLQNRAKIFSPFAALRGYDEELAEEKQRVERVTKKFLTEEVIEDLSNRLLQVNKGMKVKAVWFREDTAHPQQPPVGVYVATEGRVESVDPLYHILRIGDTAIAFEDLLELSGDEIIEIDEYLGIREDL